MPFLFEKKRKRIYRIKLFFCCFKAEKLTASPECNVTKNMNLGTIRMFISWEQMVETLMYFHIFSSRERNEPLYFICECVLRGRAAPVMNKEQRGPRCELSGCSVVETPDNTNFRCPAISEEGLSAARLAVAALGEAGLHPWTPQHCSTVCGPSYRLHTLWLYQRMSA